jgi:hypothetical protein
MSGAVCCRTAARLAASSLQRIDNKHVNSSTFSLFGTSAGHVKMNPTLNPIIRSFSASLAFPDSIEHSHEQRRLPVTQFTEDEEMVRHAARHWANEELRPFVREMDNEGKTRPEVIQGLFDHGFMGMVSVAYTNLSCVQNISNPTHILSYQTSFININTYANPIGDPRRVWRIWNELHIGLSCRRRTFTCRPIRVYSG